MRATVLLSLLCGVAGYTSFRSQNIAAPAPGAAGAPAEPEIQYEDKKFEEDWHNEWKNGNFPGYKKTYSKDTFPGRDAVVAKEDRQSDGVPSEGLTGAHVGAYLKADADGKIER